MGRRVPCLFLAIWASLGSFATQTQAHEVRPAYLEIRETSPGRFDVLWKQPAIGDLALKLVPAMSNGWLDRPASRITAEPRQLRKHWQIHESSVRTIEGVGIEVAGLDASITDALVRVERQDGEVFQTILTPRQPTAKIAFGKSGGLAVASYFKLGIGHILSGVDHLAFVLALVLLVGLGWNLLKVITSFTLAHSITLSAGALGYVDAPPAPIEALVALSILYTAFELARAWQGKTGIAQRHPWVIAFAFGLLHGFAFAGALAETGFPHDNIPLALLLFNLGVEAGQIVFLAGVAALVLAQGLRAARAPHGAGQIMPRVATYALGGFASFWFIERTALIFS